MMTYYAYKIDGKGFIIDNYIVGGPVKVPEGCITIQLPKPAIYYKNRWNGNDWVEGATQDEIDEMIKPDPQPPSNEDRIAMLEDTILFILGGM